MISEKKWQQLQQRMLALRVSESDLEEKFVIGSGRGGQKLQKSATCVYLKHNPSGIIIKCQVQRSRQDNRYFARRRLCEKLEEQLQIEHAEKKSQADKIRRQKKRRSRRSKQKMLDDKHHQSKIKKNRRRPETD